MLKKARMAARGAILSLSIALAFGYGFYGLFTYALPLSQDNLRQAASSVVADQSEVLINGAARSYDEGRTQEAVKVLELALERLVDKTGKYSLLDGWKLERVYFLLGKCYDRLEMADKAVQNYEETLRMNPNHLAAKYNLERLQSGGDGGKGAPQPDKGQPQPKI